MHKFEERVDPEGVLEPRERARRAAHLRQAYFIELGRKSARARALKAARHSGR